MTRQRAHIVVMVDLPLLRISHLESRYGFFLDHAIMQLRVNRSRLDDPDLKFDKLALLSCSIKNKLSRSTNSEYHGRQLNWVSP